MKEANAMELFKSLELSEDELRNLRLNEYFKPKESLLGNHNQSANTSTSTSVASNSHSNSMKKKERKKFFTQESTENENSKNQTLDEKELKDNLGFLKDL